MDFIKENKLFVFSTTLLSSYCLYIINDLWQSKKKIQNLIKKCGFSYDQQLNELSSTPTMLHPYQKKLGPYVLEQNYSKTGITTTRSLGKGENLIFKICLTGGPSSGKTTAMTMITERLTERGIKVFNVPLTANLTLENGFKATLDNLDSDNFLKFQVNLIKMQMNLEDHFTDIAMLSNVKSVILCDRGVMDPRVYVSEEEWQYVLDENNWNLINLRDRRYDAVIHLVTSACGAEEYYKSVNKHLNQKELNNAIINAIAKDEKLKKCWMGHPHYSIIDNKNNNFEQKLNKTFETVCKFIGLPLSNRYMKKILIESDHVPENITTENFQVEEVFLNSEEDCENKIRKRGQYGAYTYVHSLRLRNTLDKEIQKHEIKKPITARDFSILYQQRDLSKRPLHKERKCFIWEEQLYVIDTIAIKEKEIIHLLRFDTQIKDEKNYKIPPFINVIKDVTDVKQYSSFYLASSQESK